MRQRKADKTGVRQSWREEQEMWLVRGMESITTMEMSNIIEKDDKNILETVPSFVIDYYDILLQFSKLGDRRISPHLVDLLVNSSFEMNILKRYTNYFAACKDVIDRNTGEVMKGDGICRVPIRGRIGKRDGCGTLYVTDVLRCQAVLCGKDGIKFCAQKRNALLKAAFPTMNK